LITSALTTAQNFLKVSFQKQLLSQKNLNHRVPVHGDYFMDTGSNWLPHRFSKKFYLLHTRCGTMSYWGCEIRA